MSSGLNHLEPTGGLEPPLPPYRGGGLPLTYAGLSCISLSSTSAAVQTAKCGRQAVTIRTQQAEIIRPVMLRIPIDVVYLQRHSIRTRVPFTPTAFFALLAALLDKPSANMNGNAIP